MSQKISISPAALAHLTNDASHTLKMYSVGAHGVIATNVLDARASQPELNIAKNFTQIIPSERPGATNSAVLTKKKVILPSKVGVARETTPNNLDLALGDLFLAAEESPLRWDAQTGAYTTTLDIGVDFEPGLQVKDLPTPVDFALLAQNASVEPRQVRVSRAGPPYQQVKLRCANASVQAAITAHNPGIPDKPLKIECLRELGGLRIHAATLRVFGYGLGTVDMEVRRLARDGMDFNDGSDLAVAMGCDAGKISSHSLTIRTNQSSAQLEIRSTGLGKSTVTATAGPFSNSLLITFVFPTTFIVAALVGAVIGGCTRVLRSRKQKGMKPVKTILQACLVGVIAVAAAAAGVVCFEIATSVIGTELGAFVIASISGYAGTPYLDKLVKKLTGGE